MENRSNMEFSGWIYNGYAENKITRTSFIPMNAQFYAQVKLCDFFQFSHRKRAKPCGHCIGTN